MAEIELNVNTPIKDIPIENVSIADPLANELDEPYTGPTPGDDPGKNYEDDAKFYAPTPEQLGQEEESDEDVFGPAPIESDKEQTPDEFLADTEKRGADFRKFADDDLKKAQEAEDTPIISPEKVAKRKEEFKRITEDTLGSKTIKSVTAVPFEMAQDIFNLGKEIGDAAESAFGKDFIDNDFKFTFADHMFPRNEAESAQNFLREMGAFVALFSKLPKLVNASKALVMGNDIFMASVADAILHDPGKGTVADMITQDMPRLNKALTYLLITTDEDDSRLEIRMKQFGNSVLINYGLGKAVETVLKDKGLTARMIGWMTYKTGKLGIKAREAAEKIPFFAKKFKKIREEQAEIATIKKDLAPIEKPAKDILKADKELKNVFIRSEEEIVAVGKGKQTRIGSKDTELGGKVSVGEKSQSLMSRAKAEIKKSTGREATEPELKAVLARNLVTRQQAIQGGRNIKNADPQSAERLFNKLVGEGVNIEEAALMSMEIIEATEKVMKLTTKEGFAKSPALQKQFADEMMAINQKMIIPRDAGVSEAARTLGSSSKIENILMSEWLGISNPEVLQRIKLLRRSEKPEDLLKLARAYKRIQETDGNVIDSLGAKVFAGTGTLSSDYLNSILIQNLLAYSSVKANLFGNLANSTVALVQSSIPSIEKYAYLSVGKKVPYPGMRSVQEGEFTAGLRGIRDGFKEGMTNFGKVFNDEEVSSSFKTKFQGASTKELDQTIAMLAGTGVEGAGLKVMLKSYANYLTTANLGAKTLAGTDAFYRTILMHMKDRMMSHRSAMLNGISEGTEGYTKHVVNFTKQNAKKNLDGINRFADESLLTQPFVDSAGNANIAFGRINKMIEGAITLIPLHGAINPFFRVAANMNNFAIERLPIIRRLNPRIAAALKKGEGPAFEEAQNKMQVAMWMMMSGSILSSEGLIQGNMPYSNQTQRALGLEGYARDRGSIRFGENQSIPFSVAGPAMEHFGVGATLTQMIGHTQDQALIEQMVFAAAFATADLVAPNVLDFGVKNAFNFMEAIKSDNPMSKEVGKFIGQIGVNLTINKNAVQLKNMVVGTRASVFSKKSEDMWKNVNNAIWDEFKKVLSIPGVDGSRSMKNMLGDVIGVPALMGQANTEGTYTGSINERPMNQAMHPTKIELSERKKTEEVNRELKRLVLISPNAVAATQSENRPLTLDMPKKIIMSSVPTGQGSNNTVGAPLDVEQYDDYIMLSAGKPVEFIEESTGRKITLKVGGPDFPNLKEALLNMIRSDEFKEVNDEVKKVKVHNLVSGYRREATQLMKMLPSISGEIDRSKENRLRGLNRKVDIRLP